MSMPSGLARGGTQGFGGHRRSASSSGVQVDWKNRISSTVGRKGDRRLQAGAAGFSCMREVSTAG
jgi:hypothetical protein